MTSILFSIINWILLLLLSIAVIFPVRNFIAEPFYVSTISMEPSFERGDYFFVNKFDRKYERLDVITFRTNRLEEEVLIKRIIGLPGETVEITDGQVKIFNAEYPDGTILDESSYISDKYTPQTSRDVLKDSEYFVLGDNRDESLDSRMFGPISEDLIIGKYWFGPKIESER